MTERSTHHASFVIERAYPYAPTRVFAAWTTPEAKRRWFHGPDDWENAASRRSAKSEHKLDFRVGGREQVSGGPPGEPVHVYDALYWDIVPNERIVLTYDMHIGETRISVSLATVEFKPEAKGTRLIYTEHGAFLDGYDNPAGREEGTRVLLDQLDAALQE